MQHVNTIDESTALLGGKLPLPSAQLVQFQQRLLVVVGIMPFAVHGAFEVQDRMQRITQRRVVLCQLVDACGERLSFGRGYAELEA